MPQSLPLKGVSRAYSVSKRSDSASIKGELKMRCRFLYLEQRNNKLQIATGVVITRQQYKIGDEVAGRLLVDRELEGR